MNKYSPGLNKLLHHPQHIANIIGGNCVAPIHISIWPTNECQLHCSYCLCRNEYRKGTQLHFQQFMDAVDVLYKHGTKAIEFSGGGEPLLWKYFNEAVEYVYSKGIKLSLITNGIKLNEIEDDILSKFDWIRISISSAIVFDKINIKRLKKLTNVSASYIVGEDYHLSYIETLHSISISKNIVIRVAVERPCAKDREMAVRSEVNIFGSPLFFSDKEHGIPDGCYMPWIRAAIDWNGNFLPCPSMQITGNDEDKVAAINDKYKLCNIKDLEKWILENPMRDIGYKCKFCNCGKEINNFIHSLTQGVDDVDFV